MKKIIFVFFLLILLMPIYAADEQNSLDKESAKTSRVAALNLIERLRNQSGLSNLIGDLIENVMLLFVNIHNKAFGMEEVKSSLQMPNFTVRSRFNFGAGNVFQFLLILFLVVYFLIYSIKLSLQINFQYQELMSVFWRFIICMIFFTILPYIPPMLIKIAFSSAETITGSKTWEYGQTSLTYSSPIQMTIGDSLNTIIIPSAAYLLTSFFDIEFSIFGLSVGFDPSSIQVLMAIIYGIYLAGLIVGLIVSVQFMIRCLDLYITNFIMILILPSTLLKGWGQDNFLGYDAKTLIKYYFVNFVEIFVAAIIILITRAVFYNMRLNWGEMNVAKELVVTLVQFIGQPLILLLLMPVTSKILSSLINGQVSDNNFDVEKATLYQQRIAKTVYGPMVKRVHDNINKSNQSNNQYLNSTNSLNKKRSTPNFNNLRG